MYVRNVCSKINNKQLEGVSATAYKHFCTQLTKAYMAERSCNQLLVIDSAMYSKYVCICSSRSILLVVNNVAQSLYDVTYKYGRMVINMTIALRVTSGNTDTPCMANSEGEESKWILCSPH